MSKVRTKTFDWDDVKHGWRPASSPNFDAGGGFLATHDVMEHFTDDDDFEHELLAFGSIVYGRMHEVPGTIRAASSDLSNFLRKQKMLVKPCNPRWAKALPEEDERNLQNMLQRTRERLVCNDIFQQILGAASGEYPTAQIFEAIDNAAVWIRLGWHIAAYRFRGHSREEVVETFVDMEQSINIDHDLHRPRKGDRLVVHFEPHALRFDIHREHTETGPVPSQLLTDLMARQASTV
jgi:hypothetical protein